MRTLNVMSAGSLRLPLDEIAVMASEQENIKVAITYGPSGLLREDLEQNNAAELLVSADMGHPTQLWEQKLALPPIPFAGNSLRLMVAPGVTVPNGVDRDPPIVLDWLLGDDIRIATSTPGLDPSGDYAWECFALAESFLPGAQERLAAKALQAVGGRDPKWCHPVDGKSPVARLFLEDRTDVFLGYATSALQVASQVSGLRVCKLPEGLEVHTTCGLSVLRSASPAAYMFACLLLSIRGQSRLRQYGFRTFSS
ncbi:substrate-binding domain-containing protein [Desulfovibrio inopinatus]|uniref:substrate-binding domain-containing protein n=1 Tax=Desulfovibrio inopinatus TaxID=102109 RepID=UPI0004277040|nr:substrate-binding domain-containing protein [Desulfovibrio inopinatus]